MKTNVTMESKKSRELYGVTIRQETKDSFLSLTDLQEAYTHARVLNGWSRKDIQHDILASKKNGERIYYLLKEQNIVNTDFSVFMKDIETNGIIKVLKSLGVYKTTGRAESKQTMCNPYIWVLVAMELNPQLYAKVVMWLTDKLIFNRIEACDLNNTLRRSLSSFDNPDYAGVNTALNIKIFGYHETGMRNNASEKELHDLYRLEDNIAYCIDNGFYKSNEDVINAIKTSKIA